MALKKLHHNFLVWRIRHISNKNFILMISVLVGVCGGLAAVLLKTAVHYIEVLLTEEYFSRIYDSYLYIVFPMIGILLTVVYKVFFRGGKLGHGIPNLLYTISKKSSLVERDKMYSHMISSSLTVGFGGSVGLEAPIVTTGSAIGSNLGRLFHLGYKKRTLLIGCGSAAAIAGIFNSPIAGVIFTLEVLMLELSIVAYIPLLISAVTGAILSQYLTGGEILFNFSLTDPFNLSEIPAYIALGIFAGLISVYFTRMTFKTEALIGQVPNIFTRAVIGGTALGILIFIFPPLYGEGYSSLTAMLADNADTLNERSFFFMDISNPWLFLLFVAGILFVKVFASALTIGSGGNGGVFAPSLFVGGMAGFVMARFINLSGLPYDVSEKNFVLVGMAGVMSGILNAPLTAIFLIAEITSGYSLILPLMLVSAISYATMSYFEPHSIYTKKLAAKGELIFHDKDRTVLTLLNLRKLIETDLLTIDPDATLGRLVEVVSRSKRNIFPVVDDKNELKGIILLDDIREIMFKPKMYEDVKVKDLMHAPSDTVLENETMEEVMRKFDRTGDWNLPVVTQDGKYIGLLSKSKIFTHYRHRLVHQARQDRSIMS